MGCRRAARRQVLGADLPAPLSWGDSILIPSMSSCDDQEPGQATREGPKDHFVEDSPSRPQRLPPPAPRNLGRVLIPRALDVLLEVSKKTLDDTVLIPILNDLIRDLVTRLGLHLLAFEHLGRLKVALALEVCLDPIPQANLPVHEAVRRLGVAVARLADGEFGVLGWNDVTTRI